MATTNPHKKERFEHYLKGLGISVVSFLDLGKVITVVEDGETPEENALKKAIAGYKATGKTTFGIDYWLFIIGLPGVKQPGPFVRRIFTNKKGEREEVSDDKVLEYYSGVVRSLGGRTTCVWVSAVGLVTSQGHKYTGRFERETILTSEINDKRTPGEPLNSMQLDPVTGKYYTELTSDEWLELNKQKEKGYIEFFRKYLDEL